jgi:hypothetical protein
MSIASGNGVVDFGGAICRPFGRLTARMQLGKYSDAAAVQLVASHRHGKQRGQRVGEFS